MYGQIAAPLRQGARSRSNAQRPSPYFALLMYTEQLGRDLAITVTDATGTQTYRTYNNGRGIWATFPVEGGRPRPSR